jgi:hypothetical protein
MSINGMLYCYKAGVLGGLNVVGLLASERPECDIAMVHKVGIMTGVVNIPIEIVASIPVANAAQAQLSAWKHFDEVHIDDKVWFSREVPHPYFDTASAWKRFDAPHTEGTVEFFRTSLEDIHDYFDTLRAH